MVHTQGGVSVEQIGQRFGVSSMTVWRDLRIMEQTGRVHRVRGGAVHVDKAPAEPEFKAKQFVNSVEKQRIARYAAERFVEDGMILVLEGGTTVAGMVPFLGHERLTLLTNGLNVLVEASHHVPRLTVISCGGMLREISLTLVGPEASNFFADHRADVCFLGGTGLTSEDGLTDPNPLEIEIKRAMSRCARKRILLLDSRKLGVRSLASVLPLQDVDVLITDAGVPEDSLNWLRDLGVDVHIVR